MNIDNYEGLDILEDVIAVLGQVFSVDSFTSIKAVTSATHFHKIIYLQRLYETSSLIDRTAIRYRHKIQTYTVIHYTDNIHNYIILSYNAMRSGKIITQYNVSIQLSKVTPYYDTKLSNKTGSIQYSHT